MVNVLLGNNTNPSQADSNGVTPLMIAIKMRNLPITYALQQKGTSQTVRQIIAALRNENANTKTARVKNEAPRMRVEDVLQRVKIDFSACVNAQIYEHQDFGGGCCGLTQRDCKHRDCARER